MPFGKITGSRASEPVNYELNKEYRGGNMMRNLITFFIIAVIGVICCTLTLAKVIEASETRGLTVVAKDTATNQTGEVKLYNKSYAVIIGIDRYQNLPPDRQLSYAVNDAKGVEAVIRKNYRFDKIITLYNQEATRDRILELLTEELPAQMGEEDALFLFWAGHGNQEKGAQGKEIGYLIPYDGSTDKIRKNLTMTELRDTISAKLPAKHVFYVMDACYSGLMTTRAVDKKSRRDLSYLKEITKENVRQILTAGSKGEEVLDGGPKGHSVFTGRLIEILEAQGDFITANEIQAIIREKVYGDARGRGHNQTPNFGLLSGSGDFVFLPNIEQKLQDNKAELARLEAELQELEQSALQAQNDQKRQETERQKRVIESRIKTEELKKRQLAEEQLSMQKSEQIRTEFEASEKENEAKLVRIKAELERKRQQRPLIISSSIDAALAEIRRINSLITKLENNAAPARELIINRYNKIVSDLNAQKRGEFEKEHAFNARIQKESDQLETKKQNELALLTAEADSLREELKQLSEKEYTLDASQVRLELGKYDIEKGRFPVELKNSKSTSIVIALNGSIPLHSLKAKAFKDQYESGLIRPQVKARPSGEILKIALINDANSNLLEYENGEFLNQQERNPLVYTDTVSGLMWSRNGNIADEKMTWDDAMRWVEKLNYGGYSDWRLPTKDELEAFEKRGGESPFKWFNANGYKNVQDSNYWTSSIANYSAQAWVVSMEVAYKNYLSKNFNYYVWPVRDEK